MDFFTMTWPEPKPCEPKWVKAPSDEFLRHIKEDKCKQCRAVIEYLIREAEIEGFLRESRD